MRSSDPRSITPARGDRHPQIPHLDALLDGLVETGFTAGIAAYAEWKGQPLYSRMTGLADLASGRPIAADTVYRIYSMSKVIAAVAGLILYERGQFRMDDPLSRFLPAFKNPRVYETSPDGGVHIRPARREIFVRDLFTMGSGIPWIGTDTPSERDMMRLFRGQENIVGTLTTVEIAERVAQIPLDFDPGSHWKYGFSMDILGALVSTLSGKTFGGFIRDEICAPLGMPDTGFSLPADQQSRLATTYPARADGRIADKPGRGAYPTSPPPYESGGGGMVSTLGDYAAFARMLLTGKAPDGRSILSGKTLALLRADHLTPAQKADYRGGMLGGDSYGLGVATQVDDSLCDCGGSVGTFGWSGVAGTWVSVDPAEELFALLMYQRMPGGLEQIVPRFRAALYAML